MKEILSCDSLYGSDLRESVNLHFISSIFRLYMVLPSSRFSFGAFLSDIAHGVWVREWIVLRVCVCVCVCVCV